MSKALLVAFLIGVCVRAYPYFKRWVRKKLQALTGKRTADIFEHNYIDTEAFYLYQFRMVPCSSHISNIDIGKAFDLVTKLYGDDIMDVYQSCYFNWEQGKQNFTKSVFVLTNRIMIEMSGDFVTVLYPNGKYAFANKLLIELKAFNLPQKEVPFEINIISWSKDGLSLKPLEIKPTVLDIAKYYNDDFAPVNQVIRERLAKENDKGIVLLHGLPGTGKTTYLRHLIGDLKKKVLFVSPSVAGNLMNPEFIDLLLDNPNSILIIEDAENIMMDRKFNSDSSVSNLLNLSDGLLSDCVSVQIICTFNSSVDLIDSALMRKGRLIARYEFGKLETKKAQALSAELGFKTSINEPMTIAEIANQLDQTYERKRVEVLGFKRKEVEMN